MAFVIRDSSLLASDSWVIRSIGRVRASERCTILFHPPIANAVAVAFMRSLIDTKTKAAAKPSKENKFIN